MEAKSIFSIRAYQKNTSQAASLDASFFAFKLFERLVEFDDIFSTIYYYHSDKREKFVIKDKEFERLAKLMLAKEWYEISKFENINKPTIEYKRKLDGYSCSFEVRINNQIAFQLAIGYGYKTNGINIYHFKKEFRFNYSWYENLFKVILDSENWIFAEVIVSNNGVFEIYKENNLEFPLGWLTYYSKDLGINIPDLSNLSIEPYNGGTIIKTDDIDFLADKESFEAYKSRLRILLERFKEANPE